MSINKNLKLTPEVRSKLQQQWADMWNGTMANAAICLSCLFNQVGPFVDYEQNTAIKQMNLILAFLLEL
jgi:hypothetical protein